MNLGRLLVRSGAAFAIAASAAWSTSCGRGPEPLDATLPTEVAADLPDVTACGPAVSRRGHVIRVEPASAAQDTQNLQCAFDLAATLPGSTVQLGRGTFVSGAIFVHGLMGEVRGEGKDETLVVNLPAFHVNRDWWTSGAPSSPDNVYPFLWMFFGGRFSMHDLKFRIQGAAPTSGWVIPGLDFTDYSLGGVVMVTGREVHARLGDIAFEGEPNPQDPIFGYNLYNTVVFQPDCCPSAPVLNITTGSLFLHDCTFKSSASWTYLNSVTDAVVSLIGNHAEDVVFAIDIGPATRSTLVYAHNQVRSAQIAEVGEGGTLDASMVSLIANRLEAQQGVLVDGVFAGGTRCLIADNWIDPPSAGITLGPATSNCLVAGNHGATVVDQGSGNHVVGR